MTQDSETVAPEPTDELSEDQLAVREYFSSDRYKQRRKLTRQSRSYPDRGPAFDYPSVFEVGLPSLFAGVIGLGVLTLLAGFAMPLAMKAVTESISGRPTYVVMMVIMQTLFVPAMICFSTAAVVPMFWYGWVSLRFLLALMAVFPGCVAWLLTLAWVENGMPDDFWLQFGLVMFSSFLAAAAVAVVVQLWSPWTLTHERVSREPLPPMGIRSMIELTAIAAAGFAVFISGGMNDVIEDIMEVVALFAGLGFMASVLVVSASIAYFRAGHRSHIAAAIGFAFSFAFAFLFNGFFAALEYGWEVLSSEILIVGAVSLYGSALIFGTTWVCLTWLRRCGWTCINRKEELAANPL